MERFTVTAELDHWDIDALVRHYAREVGEAGAQRPVLDIQERTSRLVLALAMRDALDQKLSERSRPGAITAFE